MQIPLRWVAICIFILSSSLNFLDRQLLAALAPTLRTEFHLSNAEYGQILAVFSIVYAAVAPFAGWFVDRVGLNLGTSIAVTVWSLAGASTALLNSFGGLLAARTVLGAAEAAGVPAAGKANAMYLEPREFTIGAAFNQIGISLGAIGAPLIVAALAPIYGWRSTFAVCGLLGLLWVPLWWFTSRKIPPREQLRKADTVGVGAVLRDPRAWGIAIANIWVMTVYTLWTNWTTLYFVAEHGLTQDEANRRFAWIPPVLAAAGGFFGGWLAYRSIRRGAEAIPARVRACWISAVALLGTALVPLMPTASLAAAAVSLSFFWSLALSTNVYSLPLDVFGPGRAAFAVSMLTSSYGLMQTVASPAIGAMVDRLGFAPVCVGMAVLPLIGVAILHRSLVGRASRPWPPGPTWTRPVERGPARCGTWKVMSGRRPDLLTTRVLLSMIRAARAADLEAIASLQADSPDAAHWPPDQYLDYRCTIAEVNGTAAGFLVVRETAPGESEVLNLVVAKHFRRQGIARQLLKDALDSAPGDWFLEVRQSNRAAIALYESMGFTMVAERPEYYHQPSESGIVMKGRS